MKKLHITKEQFNKSQYFQRKYGKLRYVSESGKFFKTSKGKVLKFNESKKRKVNEADGDWFGVPGARFIWHGAWSDPEVEYKGYLFNYNDVEDGLLAIYREENPNDRNDEGFDDWMAQNSAEVKEQLEILLDGDCGTPIDFPEGDEQMDESWIGDKMKSAGSWAKDAAGKAANATGRAIKSGLHQLGKKIGDAIYGPFRKGDHVTISNGEDSVEATVTAGNLGGSEYEVMLQRNMNESSSWEAELSPDAKSSLRIIRHTEGEHIVSKIPEFCAKRHIDIEDLLCDPDLTIQNQNAWDAFLKFAEQGGKLGGIHRREKAAGGIDSFVDDVPGHGGKGDDLYEPDYFGECWKEDAEAYGDKIKDDNEELNIGLKGKDSWRKGKGLIRSTGRHGIPRWDTLTESGATKKVHVYDIEWEDAEGNPTEDVVEVPADTPDEELANAVASELGYNYEGSLMGFFIGEMM